MYSVVVLVLRFTDLLCLCDCKCTFKDIALNICARSCRQWVRSTSAKTKGLD